MTTCPDPGKAVGVEDRMVYLGSGLFYPPFRPFQIAFLSLINAAGRRNLINMSVV